MHNPEMEIEVYPKTLLAAPLNLVPFAQGLLIDYLPPLHRSTIIPDVT